MQINVNVAEKSNVMQDCIDTSHKKDVQNSFSSLSNSGNASDGALYVDFIIVISEGEEQLKADEKMTPEFLENFALVGA